MESLRPLRLFNTHEQTSQIRNKLLSVFAFKCLKESGNKRDLKVILKFSVKPTHNALERRNPRSP